MAVLVDSSVWISAAISSHPECLQLRKLIKSQELIHIVRPIQVEVCQGARTEEEFHKLWNAFLGFECLEIETRHWGLTAWNYFRLRKKGKTVSTLDCLIGTLCSDYGVPLWTLDKPLQAAHAIVGFDVYLPR